MKVTLFYCFQLHFPTIKHYFLRFSSKKKKDMLFLNYELNYPGSEHCPIALTEYFLERMGFDLSKPTHKKYYLHSALKPYGQGGKGNVPVSHSTSLKHTRKLVEELGFVGKFGNHSCS